MDWQNLRDQLAPFRTRWNLATLAGLWAGTATEGAPSPVAGLLADEVAVVTGASRGIAQGLRLAGARVSLIARNELTEPST